MSSTTGVSVKRSIVVDASQERAFDTFVDMTAWWPLDTHTIGEAPARASIVEPRVGGRWYGIDKNGDEHGIGYVLAYDRPSRLVLTWQINCDWGYDEDLKTEVEVRFVPEGPDRTRIELEHRNLEAYGAAVDAQRERYEQDGAWTYILERFAKGVNRA